MHTYARADVKDTRKAYQNTAGQHNQTGLHRQACIIRPSFLFFPLSFFLLLSDFLRFLFCYHRPLSATFSSDTQESRPARLSFESSMAASFFHSLFLSSVTLSSKARHRDCLLETHFPLARHREGGGRLVEAWLPTWPRGMAETHGREKKKEGGG